MAETTPADGSAAKQRAAAAAFCVNLPLSAVKIGVGVATGSHALVADGVHSLSDLIGDVAVFLAVRWGDAPPDENHPFGHGRFEALATVAVAGLLLLVAFGLAWDVAAHLAGEPVAGPVGEAALAVAALSIVVKEGLFRWTIRVARRTRSAALAANAWHQRSDALSSVVAVAGIGLAMLGAPAFDAIAALVIAVMLAHVAWRHGWPAVEELADTGVAARDRAAITAALEATPGVRGCRDLRARRLGPVVSADVSLFVDPAITISEAHRIAEAARAAALASVESLGDLVVHVEPLDHADGPAATEAPLRDDLIGPLEAVWAPLAGPDVLAEIRLGYLDDGLVVEAVMAPGVALPSETIAELRRRAAHRLPRGARLAFLSVVEAAR
ncbi:MAG: cation transporter [Rhodobacteraceae bacterium]|nr:MAG: cation transporter [Paracoccaceae bacterium]